MGKCAKCELVSRLTTQSGASGAPSRCLQFPNLPHKYITLIKSQTKPPTQTPSPPPSDRAVTSYAPTGQGLTWTWASSARLQLLSAGPGWLAPAAQPTQPLGLRLQGLASCTLDLQRKLLCSSELTHAALTALCARAAELAGRYPVNGTLSQGSLRPTAPSLDLPCCTGPGRPGTRERLPPHWSPGMDSAVRWLPTRGSLGP